ncbi:MFS transporter [Actinopolymorpha pittospori]|uniref:EmrB/QacA subfamily drug resistance transporter n=1 Tax=Actinopolymorpha pittospori TaxID=648752 RepID=A0A927RAT4_9ACTN|nr:EmrB/QacA subfamily drug resistance transporter [Actinopolymorpha pittospori]
MSQILSPRRTRPRPSARSAAVADAAAAASTGSASWGPLFVVLAGLFMTTLDFFIVNVAIPSTQQDLGAGPAAIQFIVAGYGLALAAGLITAGRLGDLYGRRRIFALGLAVFTVASAACGVAPSAGLLIAARVAQGAAAALLTPQVLAILSTVYSGAQRARAYRAFGLTLGFAGVFGQLIGGVLIRVDIAGLGWRTIFLINVPVGVVTLALIRRVLPESRAENRSRLDLLGTALAAVGLVGIVLPLVEGPEQGWPLWTWACLAGAVVVLVGFVAQQRRLGRLGRGPLLDLALFRARAFSAGSAIGLAYLMAAAPFFLFLAVYLQEGRGLSALESGVIFIPLGLGYFASSLRAGALAARLGRQVMALGGGLLAAGLGVLCLTALRLGTTGAVGWLIPGLVIAGAGMGLVIGALPGTVLAGVQPAHASAASGMLSTAQQVGGSIGVAVVGLAFYGRLGDLGQSAGPAGIPSAFALSLEIVAAICVGIVVLAQLLPRSRAH